MNDCDGTDAIDAEVRAELDRLILRRVRVGLGFGLATVAAHATVNHLWWKQLPHWSDVLNLVVAALIGIGFGLTKLQIVARHPAAFALLTFSIGCVARALAGIWQGGVVITALMLGSVPLITAGMIPWGLLPQVGIALVAGAAIAANALLVGQGFGGPPGQAAATIALGLLASVVLAVEVQRHRLQTLDENVRRRQAEERLARLNVDLERRVAGRTEELQRSRASLTALIDNTSDAIWSVDRELTITAMNAVARQRFLRRYDAKPDLEGRARVEPQLVDEFHAYYRRALAGEHVQVARSYDERDGTRHYLTSVHPIVENGAVTGATVFSKDVTENRRAEELARAHQAELAHVLRVSTVGEMAAGLAHEINQPLGAIANYAQGAVRRLRDGSITAAELLPIDEAIAREALRAGDIIRRLRELLRKEAPIQGPADLNQLVRDSVQFVEEDARELDISVQVHCDARIPVVRCTGVQIEQVILNLLLNSVDAVRAAGNGDRRVSITTRAVGTDTVEVAVRDSGPGLPDADVFAPFYTTKDGGLGMGLSISRSIVEGHGGRLEAVSNSDGGSTFRFTLPVAGLEVENGVGPSTIETKGAVVTAAKSTTRA